jgi:hypothetical protein
MNLSDRKLVSVFKVLAKRPTDSAKQERARAEFREMRTRVDDSRLCGILDECVQELSMEPEKRRKLQWMEAAEVIREVRDAGLAESATWLFTWWRSLLVEMPVDGLLKLAPSAAALEAWRKSARAGVADLEDELLARPALAYSTVGADWLLSKGEPKRLGPLLDLFLARSARPKHLASWADSLAAVLGRDKQARLLSGILAGPGLADAHLSALAEVVRLNRGVLTTVIETLPMVLGRKDAAAGALAFVRQIFEGLVASDGREREFLTALLARLGTGILLGERRGPESSGVLEFIEGTARQLRNLTSGDSERTRTWVFESLRPVQGAPSRDVHVSIEGARHIAVAFEKVAQGFSAKEILPVTAQNLGLSPVGKSGETLRYDPLRHEDVEGGMLPGDSARVEESGWACRGEVVMRAKVRKT